MRATFDVHTRGWGCKLQSFHGCGKTSRQELREHCLHNSSKCESELLQCVDPREVGPPTFKK